MARILKWLRIILVYSLILRSFNTVIQNDSPLFMRWGLAIIGVIVIVITYRIAKFLANPLLGVINWLARMLRHRQKLRYQIILLLMLVLYAAIFYLVGYTKIDIIWKGASLLFGFIFIAALSSIVGEETRRQKTYLARHRITPEAIAENPQANLENAFTIFEDHLRHRMGVGADMYSEDLINLAFSPKNGRLRYGAVSNEQQGVRNFISGAYATFRNPRKHRVIQDDERTVHAIISLVELLIWLVDEAEDCPTDPCPPSDSR